MKYNHIIGKIISIITMVFCIYLLMKINLIEFIVVPLSIIGMIIGHYIITRCDDVEDIEKTVNGKRFKIFRSRKWYE